MSLTFLVDATSLPANAGGVGRYLVNLVAALDQRDEVELVIASQRRDVRFWAEHAPRASIESAPGWVSHVAGRLLWEQLRLPTMARRARAQVILSPHYTMPLATTIPVVVTLHDATFFSHPHRHTRLKRTFFRTWTRLSVRRAAVCLTPSQASLDEIRRATGQPLDSALVAHHGIDITRFTPQPAAARQRVESLFTGTGPFVGFVGTIEPRKNVVPLIEAFVAAIADERFAQWRLLIVGSAGWDDRATQLLSSGVHAPSVQWLGFLDDDDLPAFLSAAELIAYPSEGEGFGLPVLEAMACGTAVLTTDRLALPEVGGPVACYTEPERAALTTALRALMADAEQRAERAAAGPARAAQFSWTRSAEIHIEAVHRALGAAR